MCMISCEECKHNDYLIINLHPFCAKYNMYLYKDPETGEFIPVGSCENGDEISTTE